MAKLKFDRNILLKLGTNDSTSVPSDEVWKGTLISEKGSSINYKILAYDSPYTDEIHTNTILGGGYRTKKCSFYRCCIQSSVVPFAKEVSLA